ncbi:MAG: winged helix-turn-helix domain-containing protein [Candidatus Acidiferrales bacterium]|jgi:DNA-binding winged helix-turn-helix (wHTH) protein
MPQPAPDSAMVQFDVYALDLRAGELFKSGRKIKLQEQPFRILTILLEHPGELVTREALRQRLWSEDTFVDFEHSLNTAIKKLRRALCDEADKPRFVETLPRRGYRFVGSVEDHRPPSPHRSGEPSKGLVGKTCVLRAETGGDFVTLAIDEKTMLEKQKLEAAADDLGLSLLFAAEKLLVLRTDTRVKVLEARPAQSCYEVRILEGEHMAKTAVVPDIYLV